jgi:hypothetical protein
LDEAEKAFRAKQRELRLPAPEPEERAARPCCSREAHVTLRNLLFMYRHKKACRQLQRLTEANRNSYENRRYRERRTAALSHTRKAT